MRDSRREFIGLAIALGIIVVLVANLFQGRLLATGEDEYTEWEVFSTALEKVRDEYVREVSTQELLRNALSGMLSSLDAHSSYILPEMYDQLKTDTEGEFEGVGMELTVDPRRGPTIGPGNPLFVRRPLPGTPAFRSGIIEGDRIAKIDGENTDGLTINEAVNKIKGPRGTKVTLTIERLLNEMEESEVFDVELVREKIPLHSIAHTEMTDDGIAHIRIADFKEHTVDELKEKIDQLRQDGMKALVLDLRYNPGGLLKSAAEVADLFLPQGEVIVSTKGRRPVDAMTMESEQDVWLSKEDCPMAVLVNGSSASASEIVTGALQENGRAIVIGSKTYGKGSVQTVIPLMDKSALRLTTAYFYTPRGQQLSNNGIEPDIKVALSREDDIRLRQQLPDDTKGPKENSGEEQEQRIEDVQLKEAITVLRGYVVLAHREKAQIEEAAVTR
jgi:carboxyl-terminal processing protease